MAKIVPDNSSPAAVPNQKLLEWIVTQLSRLIKKIDGVTNFAVNSPESLSAFPYLSPVATMQREQLVPKWMKIKTAANTSGVAVCNLWDGTTADTGDIPVRITGHRAVGETLFATIVRPKTGVQLAGVDVPWLEIPVLYDFAVVLQQTGGTAGTQTTPCSFTYTVKNADGSFVLGTVMTPQTPRPNGKMFAATSGDAYITATGIFTLRKAEEFPDTGSCP